MTTDKIRKVAIIGSDISASITALHFKKYLNKAPHEICIYPTEVNSLDTIRQSCDPQVLGLISEQLDIDHYSNNLDITYNSGFLYQGWSKMKNKLNKPFEIYTPYSQRMHDCGCHLNSKKLFDCILQSKDYIIKEETIKDPEEEIDADVIFDCRNGYDRDKSKYRSLKSVVNSVLISNKKGKRKGEKNLTYTKFIAAPNGWAFVIPDLDSIQYGYVYNNTISSKEDATEYFLKTFNLSEVDSDFTFESYAANKWMEGNKTILQGYMYSSVEPMDNRLHSLYKLTNQSAWDLLMGSFWSELRLIDNINAIEKFIMWHYHFGSKYKTDFWKMGESLPFIIDADFKDMIDNAVWETHNFEKWAIGVGYNYGHDVIETMKSVEEFVKHDHNHGQDIDTN